MFAAQIRDTKPTWCRPHIGDARLYRIPWGNSLQPLAFDLQFSCECDDDDAFRIAVAKLLTLPLLSLPDQLTANIYDDPFVGKNLHFISSNQEFTGIVHEVIDIGLRLLMALHHDSSMLRGFSVFLKLCIDETSIHEARQNSRPPAGGFFVVIEGGVLTRFAETVIGRQEDVRIIYPYTDIDAARFYEYLPDEKKHSEDLQLDVVLRDLNACLSRLGTYDAAFAMSFLEEGTEETYSVICSGPNENVNDMEFDEEAEPQVTGMVFERALLFLLYACSLCVFFFL